MSNRSCFVIQPFDGSHYDDLFDEVYSPAITAAGFEPYRVDRDPSASVLIDSIEKKISEADAVFAEISENNPNVWYELGFARAQGKPLCMVCSKAKEKLPFDIQHRQVIFYPERRSPGDFLELKSKITERFKALAAGPIQEREEADIQLALNSGPSTAGLRQHEISALTVVAKSFTDEPLSAYTVINSMDRFGFNETACHIAMAALKQRGLVERVELYEENGRPFTAWQITEKGMDWLVNNQAQLSLKSNASKTVKVIGNDEDIPF